MVRNDGYLHVGVFTVKRRSDWCCLQCAGHRNNDFTIFYRPCCRPLFCRPKNHGGTSCCRCGAALPRHDDRQQRRILLGDIDLFIALHAYHCTQQQHRVSSDDRSWKTIPLDQSVRHLGVDPCRTDDRIPLNRKNIFNILYGRGRLRNIGHYQFCFAQYATKRQ